MAANWESLSIQIPGQDLLEGARNVLETLMVYLEVLKAILDTVKVFAVDFGNPIKAIVEALLTLVLDLFETLRRTGVYGWFDVPDPLKDPNFNRFVGGFPAFVTRFKAGLYDPRDPNRPQPIAGATQGGFTIIVADAESPNALIKFMGVLLRFFSKEFITPRYPAPANFKVLPVKVTPTGAGDPIVSLSALFQEQPTSVAVEWSLPPTESPGDPGFSDLIQSFSKVFIPPKFLIEKSEVNPIVGKVDIADINDADAAGQVTAEVVSEFRANGMGGKVTRTVALRDFYNDPFLKFQKYIVVDATHSTTTFILGQLGTFRYIDTDVEQNKVYYYRVRAFSGSLRLDGDRLFFSTTDPDVNVIDTNPYIAWPRVSGSDEPIMGKASPVTPIMLPTYPAQFDVIETLKRLFQTAFSLNFHLPPEDDTAVGVGSLTQLAGALSSFRALPLVGDAVSNISDVTAKFQPSRATDKLPEPPWIDSRVRRNSARLATIVSSAMLQANSAVAFKALMESYPSGVPSVGGLQAINVKEMVYEITKVQDINLEGQGGVQAAGVLYGQVFDNPIVRQNVLAAVEFCKAFTLVGSGVDWVQLSVFRDIAPWSGQLIYQMLAKMQALLDAYSGVMSEINAFINLIEQKIDTLEQFLQYLTSILNFVESLSLGFYILSVPSTGGDVNEWVSLVDNAGGTKPPSGPGGYTGGVAFAYVGPDVAGYAEAFNLIF
jgi:hypothetical protein